MVTRLPGWTVHVAGAVALAGYGLLARAASQPEARGWLGLALVIGWLAVAVAAWSAEDNSPRRRFMVVGWAILFRLVGLGTTPSWEDDYYRYLWDGYQTVTTGNPYAAPPLEFFGREDVAPAAVAAALDGINHPELPTIYGPGAQAGFAVAALVRPGNLLVLKLGLVLAELAGWWALGRRLGWRGWVLVWWCPLAVTEIAFVAHVDALGVASVAAAVGLAASERWRRAAVLAGGAVLVKAFGWVLAPFLVVRGGWRAGVMMGAVALAGYSVFLGQGSAAEWPAVQAMSARFEYNSTGYAVMAALVPEPASRRVALALALALAGVTWCRWVRSAGAPWEGAAAAALGWGFLFAPVMNPWYALWLLPLLAVRPTPWGIGVLLAVPLAYVRGWGSAGGATVDYTHAVWVRPTEVALVLVVIGVAAWWRRLETKPAT